MVSRKKMVKIYLVNKYANGLVSKVNLVKMLGDNWCKYIDSVPKY